MAMKRTLVALALAAGLVPLAQATTTVSASNGTLHTTAGLTGFQTDGNEMGGMQITAAFGGLRGCENIPRSPPASPARPV